MALKLLDRPILKPRPERLPKGKAVTIGIGFRCDAGVVLCSDTQITWKGKHKTHESKLFCPAGHDWRMASIYAGDPHLWKAFRDKFSELTAARPCGQTATGKELKEITETALCYFDELNSDPMALTLIVGVVIPNKEIKLFKTEGTKPSEIYAFDYMGCGDSSVLRYLTPIMADRDKWPTIGQALRLGVHWVLQAKRYAEDCGGDTEAFVLGWDGSMQNRSNMTYNWEQELLCLEKTTARVYQALGDASVNDEEFERRLDMLRIRLREERSQSS